MALILLGCWPAWPYLWGRWLDGSDEPLGVLAALLLVWLAWGRRGPVGTSIPCTGLLVYALVCPWAPNLVGAAVAVLAVAAAASQARHGRVLPGWLGLALLSLPSLASLQFFLGYPARVAAAECAAWLLGLEGYAVHRQGVELVWGQRHLLVDTPCSGLASLWMIMFLAMGLAALRHWKMGQTARLAGLAVLVAWTVNVLRLCGLFYSELVLRRPEVHTAIGVVAFVLGAALVMALAPASAAAEMAPLTARAPRRGLLALAVGVALLGLVRQAPGPVEDFPGWPVQLAGSRLELLEEVEVAGFPGRIGRFRAGGENLILRWVNRPTRLLHSSADCFRAQGLTFAGSEVIYDADGHSFADVSQWFWAAALGRSRGPWLAVTRVY